MLETILIPDYLHQIVIIMTTSTLSHIYRSWIKVTHLHVYSIVPALDESCAHFVAHSAYACWYMYIVMMISPADLIKCARQHLTAGLRFRMVYLQDTPNNVKYFYRSVTWTCNKWDPIIYQYQLTSGVRVVWVYIHLTNIALASQ